MIPGRSDRRACRCPVGGHREGVELPRLFGALFDCPHCDTTPKVEAGPAERIGATAGVADSAGREPHPRHDA